MNLKITNHINLEYFIIAAFRRCGGPGLPSGQYGYTNYPPPRNFIDGTVPRGYTVNFGCRGGKTLVGSRRATCQDGTWSASPGSCV